MAGRFPLLTDENVSGPIVAALIRQGWDVLRAVDTHGERSDDEVLFSFVDTSFFFALDYLARYKEQRYSPVDCISFVVMEAFGIHEALLSIATSPTAVRASGRARGGTIGT